MVWVCPRPSESVIVPVADPEFRAISAVVVEAAVIVPVRAAPPVFVPEMEIVVVPVVQPVPVQRMTFPVVLT
jgi:hypothetical protein